MHAISQLLGVAPAASLVLYAEAEKWSAFPLVSFFSVVPSHWPLILLSFYFSFNYILLQNIHAWYFPTPPPPLQFFFSVVMATAPPPAWGVRIYSLRLSLGYKGKKSAWLWLKKMLLSDVPGAQATWAACTCRHMWPQTCSCCSCH